MNTDGPICPLSVFGAREKKAVQYIFVTRHFDATIFYLIDNQILKDDKNTGFYKSKLWSTFEKLIESHLSGLIPLGASQIGIFNDVDFRINKLQSKFRGKK